MMLSRVADSLYWMGRYVERAENIARTVNVNQQLILDLPSHQANRIAKDWFAVVAALGEEESFLERYKKRDMDTVSEFLIFDRSHPSSIVGSLSAARENARTVREQITTEMWEQINRSYLWLISKSARQFYEKGSYEFFQRVKKALQLFQGITESVMLHGEGWEFIQLGKHLERADMTSRLLDEEYFLIRTADCTPAEALNQWLAILRCTNARLVYQRLYASMVEPTKVAELLLLNGLFPRSVEFCIYQLDQSLRRLSGVMPGRFSNRAEKLSGRLLSELSFSTIEDLCEPGLHAAMDKMQVQLGDIGEAIMETYIHPTSHQVTASPLVAVGQPQQ